MKRLVKHNQLKPLGMPTVQTSITSKKFAPIKHRNSIESNNLLSVDASVAFEKITWDHPKRPAFGQGAPRFLDHDSGEREREKEEREKLLQERKEKKLEKATFSLAKNILEEPTDELLIKFADKHNKENE